MNNACIIMACVCVYNHNKYLIGPGVLIEIVQCYIVVIEGIRGAIKRKFYVWQTLLIESINWNEMQAISWSSRRCIDKLARLFWLEISFPCTEDNFTKPPTCQSTIHPWNSFRLHFAEINHYCSVTNRLSHFQHFPH